MTSRQALGRRWVGVVLGLAVAASACSGDEVHDIALEIDYGGAAHDGVVAHYVGVYDARDCSMVEPPSFTFFFIDTESDRRIHSDTFEGTEGAPVGEVAPGSYAFVAVGLTNGCQPVFRGCTMADIGEVDEVVIDMEDAIDGIYFCGLMVGCNDGYCEGDWPWP